MVRFRSQLSFLTSTFFPSVSQFPLIIFPLHPLHPVTREFQAPRNWCIYA